MHEDTSVRGLRVTPDGDATDVELHLDGSTLTGLQRNVGGSGYVDVVRLVREDEKNRPGLDMWVDDEGLLDADAQRNAVASIAGASHGFGQSYVGNVVFAGSRGSETVSLHYDDRSLLRELARRVRAATEQAQQ